MNEKSTTVQNCTFIGVQYNHKAIEAVKIIAEALLNLTQLFKTQNIQIDSLLSIKPENNQPDDNAK